MTLLLWSTTRRYGTKIIITYQKGERLRVNTRTERVQQTPSCKKDSNREHGICKPKKYRIMNEVFRKRLKRYNRISRIV
ncbi:hypothetical protein [Candidatus Nitrosocosmicus arcticus]|uniref:hypothetical protein n=1 Tax=Candidatus Nitrosocosmicus arcticus TaxID=2035267 RepID=UPI0011A176FB|nr:hypothetical protein [Candidatus Nitrosocosmicus arcticus]